jgi:hypothetical protein
MTQPLPDYHWNRLAQEGDEWIVSYACTSGIVGSASLFSIGHAFELYLKAVHTKNSGNVDEAIKFGHNVKKLWEECKKKDSSFLSDYEIRPRIRSKELFMGSEDYSTMSKDDLLHFLQNKHLYLIVEHLPDLKYFGLKWTTSSKKDGMSIGWCSHDPYWIKLFRYLRKYLEYPNHYACRISQCLFTSSECLTPGVIDFLSQISKKED